MIPFLFSAVAGAVSTSSPELTLNEQQVSLVFTAHGTPDYRVWRTSAPPRVVIDIAAEPGEDQATPVNETVEDPLLQGWRLAETAQGLRLVLDLAYPVPAPQVSGWQSTGDGRSTLAVTVPRRFVSESEFMVGAGVWFTLQRRGELYGPVTVSILSIDLQRSDIHLKVALARDSVEGTAPVSEMAREWSALAAVNGGFFHSSGLPLGLLVDKGLPIRPPLYERSAFVLLDDGSTLISRASLELQVVLQNGEQFHVNGLNRRRRHGEVVVYNHGFGPTTPMDASVQELIVRDFKVVGIGSGNTPLLPGTTVVAVDAASSIAKTSLGEACRILDRFRLLDAGREVPLSEVRLALGAGPRLLHSGNVNITDAEEQFRPDITWGRAPRTALAITADRRLLLVTVNGRQDNLSTGQTLQELAELLVELGAVEALNLDGGGSTTMVVRDRVVNMPSSGERPVGDALLVLAQSL